MESPYVQCLKDSKSNWALPSMKQNISSDRIFMQFSFISSSVNEREQRYRNVFSIPADVETLYGRS